MGGANVSAFGSAAADWFQRVPLFDLAFGGCGHANTINPYPTRAASFADHAVRLMERRGRHGLGGGCEGQKAAKAINLIIRVSLVNLQADVRADQSYGAFKRRNWANFVLQALADKHRLVAPCCPPRDARNAHGVRGRPTVASALETSPYMPGVASAVVILVYERAERVLFCSAGVGVCP